MDKKRAHEEEVLQQEDRTYHQKQYDEGTKQLAARGRDEYGALFPEQQSINHPEAIRCAAQGIADAIDQSVFEDLGGKKNDQGKPRPELIAPEIIHALGVILEFGSKKYDVSNWEKGLNWSRCFGALMRHMWAWWKGEGKDDETGESHLWHACCCLMFLVAYEERKIGNDDRP